VKTTETVPTRKKEASPASAAVPVGKPAGRTLDVWLVDDHAQLRELFAQVLDRQLGIRCTRGFASGAAILATLDEERPPDVILLDVNLGRESGLDLIRPIKKLAPKVKVVMFTTFRNVHYAADAFRAGANGFLLKTYDAEDIVRLIRQAYDQPGAGLFDKSPVFAGADLGGAPADGAAGRRFFRWPSRLRQFFRFLQSRVAH
jgi:CheY-like chemotaxis protein